VIEIVAVLVGVAAGAILDRLISRFPRGRGLPKPKPPRCSCNHAPAFHDPETSRCHFTWFEEINYRDKELQCACRKYDGPQPLEEYFAGEIAP
jgi:hypothetical protein